MINSNALTYGIDMAQKVFDKRNPKGCPQVEVHLDRNHLAALLALAFEAGKNYTDAQLGEFFEKVTNESVG